MKRWCDQGRIPTVRTPGGHRRLPIGGVLDFLRGSQHKLVRPEVLGLPTATGRGVRTLDRARDVFLDAVLDGDEDRCRQIVFDVYLAEHQLSTICDRIVAAAFEEIGSKWECGAAEVYQERRACEITRRIVFELRAALPVLDESAPVAIGGTPEGDFYELATTMVELVLTDAGWNARSLGSSLPEATLRAAVQNTRPKLLWLSVSHIEDRETFLRDYATIYEAAEKAGVATVVGGCKLTEQLRQEMQYSAHCDNLQHLEALANTLHKRATR
jgi:methanogenic corrinoid protein MtbC1